MEIPANVQVHMDEIKSRYEKSGEPDGPLLGYLWNVRATFPDVMYVSAGYMRRQGGEPARDWPGYTFVSAETHSPW